MMDGLDQVQRSSWYRDGLGLTDEATIEILNIKPLQIQVEDLKGRNSRSVRSPYFYASVNQYTALPT